MPADTTGQGIAQPRSTWAAAAHSARMWAGSVAAATRDPANGVERVREKLAERARPPGPVKLAADPRWEDTLHGLLGSGWPCDEQFAFGTVWDDALERLAHRSLAVGRGMYCGWDDADAGFARAAWCLTRHLRPRTVVETGVARGLTTRAVLQALATNDCGELASIELPPWRDRRELARQTAAAVPIQLIARWTLVEGSSRRRLPGLLTRLGGIDLFVHDSSHSYRNMSFELEQAWAALRPHGFLLVDDVHRNGAFGECRRRFGMPPGIVCPSDDGRGMFGLIHKPRPLGPAGPGDGAG